MSRATAKVLSVAAGSLLALISFTGLRAGAAPLIRARHAQTDTTTEPSPTVTTPRETRPPREPTRGTGSTPEPTTATAPPVTVSSTGSSSSSTPWALIVVLIAAAVVIIGVVLAGSRRRRTRATQQLWRTDATSALRDAELTRDMLESEARADQPEDPARRDALRGSVERAASQFEHLATLAPSDAPRQSARRVANALRGYLFALEAEQLLRTSATPPTAEQLATADSARRGRATDLETALAVIRVSVSASR
jgi:hypothetical protein